MKKPFFIIIFVVILLAAIGFAATSGLSDGKNVALRGIDLTNAANGSYSGSYDYGRWSNTLTVHIADKRITGIDIEKDVAAAFVTGIVNCSGEMFRRVIEAQDTKVDTVSGVTVTSKAYLKSIEDAVHKASLTDVGKVEISFDYEKISGMASNQFAVWIEDMNGNLIQTLYVTRWTANGGYKNRQDSIPIWVEKSGLAAINNNADISAVSGATPAAGALTYTWDLTDSSGQVVEPGKYRFVVEGTLRWKNQVLYSGDIDISRGSATAEADVEFTYESSDRNEALTGDSPENEMIGTVTARYTPSGN